MKRWVSVTLRMQCPSCRVPANAECISLESGRRRSPHAARKSAAQRAIQAEKVARPVQEEEE